MHSLANRALCIQAKKKLHSTSKEALEIAQACGAYRTVLTHFSQRYPKLPPGLEGSESATAAVAFDGMCIPLIALSDLPRLLPVLHIALGDRTEAPGCHPSSLAGRLLSADADTEQEVFSDGPYGVGSEEVEVESPGVQARQHIRFDD